VFITLEGSEGVGKTTAIDNICDFLTTKKIEFTRTREPGGTVISENIRNLLLGENNIHPDTELLLMFAARAEHIQQIILPALKNNKWVICDRFTDASYAYQGGGRNMSDDKIKILENLVQQNSHGMILQPDLTILLDSSVTIGRQRIQKRGNLDRFEQEQADFFNRVRNKYLELAKIHKHRYQIIDASKPLVEVTQKILDIIKCKC
jgi:dTMP kinase